MPSGKTATANLGADLEAGEQGSTNFFNKETGNTSSPASQSLSQLLDSALLIQKWSQSINKGYGCGPGKLYLWVLNLNFISFSHVDKYNPLFFLMLLFFPQPFKKSFLSSQNKQKQLEGQIQPVAIVCCPALEKE